VESPTFDLTEQVLGRDDDVVEHHLARVDPAVAELPQLPRHRVPEILGDDEQRHAAVTRVGVDVGLHQHREAVAVAGVGDPHLRAVQHVDAVATGGRRADGLEIGAAVGLGEGQTAAQLGGNEAGQEVGALLVGAVPAHELGDHQVRVDHPGERHPDPGDGLDDARVRGGRESESAVLLRDGGAEQTELPHLFHHVVRVLVGVLELHHPGRDLVVEPRLQRLEHRVIVGRRHESILLGRGPRPLSAPTVGAGAPVTGARE